MTSNIGTRKLKEFGTGVGFNTSAKLQAEPDHAKTSLNASLKKAFAPEFLNRLDEVIIFNSLTKEDITKIIDIELKGLFGRITDLGYSVAISKQAKDYVADQGYDEEYGARPLKRAIQQFIEDPLTDEMMKNMDNKSIKIGYTIKSGITVKLTK
jgi:ATP-dependent Clp protease ATP-binding subunit ClpC